jgi:hypothetical protein
MFTIISNRKTYSTFSTSATAPPFPSEPIDKPCPPSQYELLSWLVSLIAYTRLLMDEKYRKWMFLAPLPTVRQSSPFTMWLFSKSISVPPAEKPGDGVVGWRAYLNGGR